MNLFQRYQQISALLEKTSGDWLIPLIVRFAFAAVLLNYFLRAALTKIGTGPFTPNPNAYAQIFPNKSMALNYDPDAFSQFDTSIVLFATWAEFILPVLIVVGLATRFAAFGMIIFVMVQSYVDATGHGVTGKHFGRWFDGAPDALIMDQRTLWIVLLLVLVFKGAGACSVDGLIRRGKAS